MGLLLLLRWEFVTQRDRFSPLQLPDLVLEADLPIQYTQQLGTDVCAIYGRDRTFQIEKLAYELLLISDGFDPGLAFLAVSVGYLLGGWWIRVMRSTIVFICLLALAVRPLHDHTVGFIVDRILAHRA